MPGAVIPLSSRRAGKAEVRETADNMVCTTVHWHAHAVGALCFSLDGKFLLSGGQEAVLVRPQQQLLHAC